MTTTITEISSTTQDALEMKEKFLSISESITKSLSEMKQVLITKSMTLGNISADMIETANGDFDHVSQIINGLQHMKKEGLSGINDKYFSDMSVYVAHTVVDANTRATMVKYLRQGKMKACQDYLYSSGVRKEHGELLKKDLPLGNGYIYKTAPKWWTDKNILPAWSVYGIRPSDQWLYENGTSAVDLCLMTEGELQDIVDKIDDEKIQEARKLEAKKEAKKAKDVPAIKTGGMELEGGIEEIDVPTTEEIDAPTTEELDAIETELTKEERSGEHTPETRAASNALGGDLEDVDEDEDGDIFELRRDELEVMKELLADTIELFDAITNGKSLTVGMKKSAKLLSAESADILESITSAISH